MAASGDGFATIPHGLPVPGSASNGFLDGCDLNISQGARVPPSSIGYEPISEASNV